MAKIVKDGLIFSGTPKEIVTAWPPTENGLEVELPTIGTTDISSVGDGTITGAIKSINDTAIKRLYGHVVFSNIASNGSQSITVNLPSGISNTNYSVIVTPRDGSAYWTWMGYHVTAKTTTSFTINVYNDNTTNAVANYEMDWTILY